MQELIDRVVAATGLAPDKATKALGIVLNLIQTQGNQNKVKELLDKMPGAAELAAAIQSSLPSIPREERELSVRRVFQAIRIEVNGEFTALDTLLRTLPDCLNPGGRAAILTFHSGEDRRVKKSLQAAHREGLYREIARRVVRAGSGERHANPRSTSAKLRWAIR